MHADWDANVVLDWMRAHPSADGHELGALAERFGVDRARLRDRLRRLVDADLLTLSAPIPGLADNNPSYTPAAVSSSPRHTARVCVADPRAASSRAQLLAWDVAADRDGELATYLLRADDGAYLLASRPGHASPLAGAVRLLTRDVATAWFRERGSRIATQADAFPSADA